MEQIFTMTGSIWKWMLANTFYINILLSIAIIFFQRRDTKAVWAWLLLLYFVPIIGFFLYLLIGLNTNKSKMFRIKEVEDEINAAIKEQENSIFNNEFVDKFHVTDERLQDYRDLVLYNLETAKAEYCDDNEVRIFTDGDDKFAAMLETMRHARKFIHLQYYIISDGELFREILDVLVEQAKRGVEVRILYDSLGSRKIGKKNLLRMRRAGIKTAEFFPAFLGIFQFRINYRNHRKIAVIDGKTAYVGGFNIGDEYIDRVKRFGHWRDTHFEIKGEAVNALHLRFMLDWNYAARENLFKVRVEQYFNTKVHARKEKIGIQIITSGPDSRREEIRDNYLRLINKAKERIYIQTPYFIPDDAVLQSLKIAALSGVDVRLMIPCKPDHPLVYWITYSYAGDLLEAGARCYCFDDGFLHAKGMVVDGLVSCYGTANMDVRSFKLDFEVNAVIYSPEVSMELEKIFLNDLLRCSEITKYDYDRRTLGIRIKEQLSRLFAPLM